MQNEYFSSISEMELEPLQKRRQYLLKNQYTPFLHSYCFF